MDKEIKTYNDKQTLKDKEICDLLAATIDSFLIKGESKIWHGHPVWFLDGNPIVGFSKLKSGVQLLFWSGQTFEEEKLIKAGKFKATEIRFNSTDQINLTDLKRWLKKSNEIQWDYKNFVKRKGQLEKLK